MTVDETDEGNETAEPSNETSDPSGDEPSKSSGNESGDPSSNETIEPSGNETIEPESPSEGDGIVEPDGNELLDNETEELDENATLENETEPEEGEPAELYGLKTDYAGQSTPTEEDAITRELIGTREEFVKHFMLEDGQSVAISYPQAVHFQRQGEWEQIDNTLKETDGGYLTNAANSWKVLLPVVISEQNAIHVDKGEHRISFSFEGVKESEIEVIEAPEPVDAFDAATWVSYESDVRYEGVAEGIDLEYQVLSHELKENVVIESLEVLPESFDWTVTAEGLTFKVGEEGSLLFVDGDGATIFELPEPIAYDATGFDASDVEVSVEDKGEGVYRISYAIDREWASSPDRVWPITLDPGVISEQSITNIDDACAYSWEPNRTTASDRFMVIGKSSHGQGHGFIRINTLPYLSPSDNVTTTFLRFYAEGYSPWEDSVMKMHMVDSASTVNYNAITWNNQPSYQDRIIEYKIFSSWYGFHYTDITEAVRQWYAGEAVNNGIAIDYENYDVSVNDYGVLYSVQYSTYYAPRLIVKYISSAGLDDAWDYTSQDVGRAGVAYVQDSTGNLIISRTDMGFGGFEMPASMIFNYDLASKDLQLGYGYGWRVQYVGCVYLDSSGEYPVYIWTDGDRTVKYFAQYSDGWHDEMGEGLTLTINSSATGDQEKFVIKDKSDNALCFDSYGRPVRVVKAYGSSVEDSLHISYTSAGNQVFTVKEVVDGADRHYRFNYNSSTGLLERIDYKGTGDTVLESVEYSYSSGYLTSVTYVDGEDVSYSYDSSGRPIEICGIECTSGYRDTLDIDYTAGSGYQHARVTSLSFESENMQMGSLDFTYGHATTRVTDANDHFVVYQFNEWGNTTAVYDDMGCAVYGRYARDEDSSNRANQLISASVLQDTVTGDSDASRQNLLSNTDFSNGSNGWWDNVNHDGDGVVTYSSSATDDVNINKPAKLDDNVFRFTGWPWATWRISQVVSQSGSTGTVVTFGCWIKSTCTPLQMYPYAEDYSYPKRAGIEVVLLSGSTEVGSEYVKINDETQSWQFISGKLVAPDSFDTIEYRIVYENCLGSIWIDAPQLFIEGFDYVYDYDTDGNLTSMKDPEGHTTTYTYDSSTNDLHSIEFPSGASYTYNNNNNRQLTQTVSATGLRTQYGYSDSSLISTTIRAAENSSEDHVLKSEYTYTSDANMLASETDTRRITTTYVNDIDRSRVESVTTPVDVANDLTTYYNYDTIGRLIETDAATSSVEYTYSDDLLESITHSNTASSETTYSFVYGPAGLVEQVKVGTYKLVSYIYDTDTWNVTRQTYGNGDFWAYEYLENGLLEKCWNAIDSTSAEGFSYSYDSKGRLWKVTELDLALLNGAITGETAGAYDIYTYDSNDRLTSYVQKDANDSAYHSISCSYDNEDRVTSSTEEVDGIALTNAVTYDDDSRPASFSYTDSDSNQVLASSLSYDDLSRLSSNVVSSGNSPVISTTYSYHNIDSTYTTTDVESLCSTFGNSSLSLNYTYDVRGNIVSISDGTNTTTYAYDALGQLTEERNEAAGKAWSYMYDAGGNILYKTEYDIVNNTLVVCDSATYTYGDVNWGDKLTALGNSQITYDTIGNPLSYKGMTLDWQMGRKLTSVTQGSITTSYTYNETGLRTSKDDGTTYHQYIWNGSQLTADITADNTLRFLYDDYGFAVGFLYLDDFDIAPYFYVKDLQGDVIAIVDATGSPVATYTYDAWGNVLTSTGGMASVNPLRYRGYYFDSETGFYYLQSRYYDPQVGRFINADSELSENSDLALGYNLFAYCWNNPVLMSDYAGTSLTLGEGLLILGVTLLAAAAIVLTAGAATPAVVAGEVAVVSTVVATDIAGGLFVAGCTSVAAGLCMSGEEQSESKIKRDNCVYVMRDKMGRICYVGRTNDLVRRTREHKADPTKAGLRPPEAICPNVLSVSEARFLEQAVIATVGLDRLLNKRREIAAVKMHGFGKEMLATYDLYVSFVESEMLCIIEGDWW
ncbi:MAG: hypothetical protein IJJ14_07925 [Coriobacteriales bacterium]|nr:hypothetical protein [Coriobacteriales bacterium]